MKLTYGNLSLEVSPTASPEEHKEAFEAFGRLCGFVPGESVRTMPSEATMAEIRNLMESMSCGHKIHAIKALRNLTGMTLVDAKNTVENYAPVNHWK